MMLISTIPEFALSFLAAAILYNSYHSIQVLLFFVKTGVPESKAYSHS